ncbi:hypothetical protein [Streptacidiphilus fuscans]|uniref:hypothetical protein n=1 Tax=Streptacidiphilus fuscans TaxID=2789292 RepID=UPI002E2D5B53|nr:hypothetical protein [Streptacidiphilus fuscans]
MGNSALYRVVEPFPDAATAVARAREILGFLSEGYSDPWVQPKPIVTREQFEHAVAGFPTAQIMGIDDRDVPPFLDELARRGAVFEREEPSYRFKIDLRLAPELLDLWPLPSGLLMSLGMTSPFGGPDSTDEDDSTEAELDEMVAVLGPLALNVSWSCKWRGLPRAKMCGLQLCLNGVWDKDCMIQAPGEFGLWVSTGSTPENRAVRDTWREACGLDLGPSQVGW